MTDHFQPGDKCVCEGTHVLHRHIDIQEGKEENFDAIEIKTFHFRNMLQIRDNSQRRKNILELGRNHNSCLSLTIGIFFI